jgi:hypothetical protein
MVFCLGLVCHVYCFAWDFYAKRLPFASYACNSRESQAYEVSGSLLHASHITKWPKLCTNDKIEMWESEICYAIYFIPRMS